MVILHEERGFKKSITTKEKENPTQKFNKLINVEKHVSAFFLVYSYCEQTFDAKLVHIESRPGKNSKNGTTDLEFLMKCEVHGSDVDVFIDSLKRVVEDVRSVPEEKGEDRRPPVMQIHAN